MADLLSAASLLLTVITILYSLWYPEIGEALKLPVDEHSLNNEPAYKKCRALWRWKMVPLAIAAVTLCLVNSVDAFQIVVHAINQLHLWSSSHYSAVRTAFVLVEVMLAFLAGHTVVTTKALGAHIRKLDPNR